MRGGEAGVTGGIDDEGVDRKGDQGVEGRKRKET